MKLVITVLLASVAFAQTTTLSEVLTVTAAKTTCTITAVRNFTVKLDCSDGSKGVIGSMGLFATEDIAVMTKRLPDGKVEMQVTALDADGKSVMKHQGLLPVVQTPARYVPEVQ